jgi:hypothetical protein
VDDQKDKANNIELRIETAVAAPIPHLYFNGYVNTMTSGDVMIVFEWNRQPVATINGSFTLIKSLAASLQELVARLEDKAERPIMTTKDIEAFLAKAAEEAGEATEAPQDSKIARKAKAKKLN